MPEEYKIPDNEQTPQNSIHVSDKRIDAITGGVPSNFNGTLDNKIPYHIPDVLQQIVGPLIRIPHPTLTQIGLDFLPIYHINPPLFAADEPYNKLKSKLGTPIMEAVSLIVYGKDVGMAEFATTGTVTVYPPVVPIAGEMAIPEVPLRRNKLKFTLLDVLVSVTQPKKIIRTEIAGNNTTVKEFIGLNDYEINISGRLTGDYGSRSVDILNLLKILTVNKTIGVTSRQLADLGITDMVITDFDLPQTEGEYSTQYFTINGVSDLMPENKFIKTFKP